MGREVRRVVDGFDWPLGQVWTGFLLPGRLHGTPCEACAGSGQTHAGWWLQHFAQRLTMLADDIRDQEVGRPLHPWLAEDPYPHGHLEGHRFEIDRPSADIRELVEGLGASGGLLGYSGHHVVYQAIVKAAGLESWGVCEACGGHGDVESYPGQRAEAEAWEPIEPPAGSWWQLWETVSEGSPVSPAFATADELARWIVRDGGEFEGALAWVTGPGWSPSGFVHADGVVTADDLIRGTGQ